MSQQFFYKAVDHRGNVVQGQLDANNVSDLETRLERMGLDLIHYHTKKPRNIRIGKVNRVELITFCFHMETLTRAGVPLIEGLSDFRDSLSQSRFREIISSLIESIEGGERLSEAMGHFPDTFNQVFTSLIRAGEESGKLSVILHHLTETLKWQDELIARTKKLLMYPAFMGTVIIIVLFFLMLYLVPQLVTFIENLGGELPFHTRALIFISNIFIDYWHIILFVPFVLFVLLKVAMKVSMGVCLTVDRIKLKVWIIGPILEKIILARFSNFFGILYASGITILDGLKISKDFVGNRIIEIALQDVIDNITDGVGITESFERVRLFPPLVLRMIKIGETTGELDIALTNVSYFYDREVKESIDKIQTMVEPVMIVTLGLLLGWIMVSVLLPIYDTITSVVST